ncbi:MAG: FG-GAP repeat domain-containing protein [Gemmatimonadota bacterium]
MKRSALLGVLLAACASASSPQPASAPASASASADFVRAITPFPVLDEQGRAYTHSLIGGFDVPRPQFIDIDGDRDLDLFVQERSNELMFFENTGTPGRARFEWRTDRYHNLAIGEWNRFVDLDRDGDFDLLAEEPFSYIGYYRNEGTAQQPIFKLAADSLRDDAGRPIFADRQNIPNLTDIDCDGSLDLFLGRVEGTLTRFEAVAATLPVPRFRFITDRFEGIEIIGQIGSARHGASTMYWADYDDDGDADLFWGDFFEPGVLLIRNVGASCQTPNLRVDPVALTVGGAKLTTSGYNVPVLADIDGDADRDLFIGVLGGAFNPSLTASDNFYLLERTGSGQFELRTKRYIAGVDVGSESVPAFGDLDGDGDLDLLLGNKLDPKKLETGRLYFFRNDGSRTQPVLRLADTLDVATAFHQAPALGDLDADGDLDLLLGTWSDGVLVFRNEGSAQAARFVQDSAATIRFTRGSNYTPALGDIDGDGDLDVLVGEASGELNLVRNEGTRARPQFVVATENFESIDAGRRSAVALADMDDDGDLDIVAGREEPGAVWYRNAGNARNPRYDRDESFSLPFHPLATPGFADLDGDGDADLFTGSLSGGLVYWEKR